MAAHGRRQADAEDAGPREYSAKASAGIVKGYVRRPTSGRLLAIYLNDHLAGATSGTEMARRVARHADETVDGPALAKLAEEIGQARDALVNIMRTLGIRTDTRKVAIGWLAERLGRLKLNGTVARRSPLSTLIELEALSVGISGKQAGWRTLRALREKENRLDPSELDVLLDRADRQAEIVETLRLKAAMSALNAP